ncbi:FMN-binding negative transcriptional regulator [Roseibacterium sp. SDUM158017]|uniref:FMN-binding negative transcriptional regulator n=1 Tax=Roseicyclus salinarum TaxID=3036773 RepID=UPI00241548B2|nr:FMN-binding negative transcriptional regulator [Roseibacterium sp. SDUM158017]MDG4647102.1 FMN-binding negative transcriptional regulator [Roseibacterium sp. SDUM158017]
MHPNPAFRATPAATSLDFARARGFGTLCVNAEGGPLLAHVPFLLNADGTEAEMHLVRSNPIARMATGQTDAVIAVQGPDGYVSPDWYGDANQVPTWNYVAVHLRGTLEPADPATMRAHLDRISAHFEGRLPKTPWTADKMTGDTLERMMRTILPFRLAVSGIDGTWKLNQNKTDAMRLAAADLIAGSGIGQELGTLARLMRAGSGEMDKP